MCVKKINRREFLKDMGLSVAGTGLVLNSVDVTAVFAATRQSPDNKRNAQMQYRTLGRTGLKVSAVSFGVMTLTDPAVLNKALDLGINYFDTAHMYQKGRNEEMLGKTLKDYGRSKVFIATKIPPWYSLKSKEKMPMNDQKTMEEKMALSLKRLQTDYVDVLFLHNIVEPEWANYEPMIAFLAKMKKEGKARFVGISFHEGRTFVDVVKAGLQVKAYDVFLAAINFKSPTTHAEALQKARKENIGIIAMKTQAGGYKDAYKGSLSPYQAALKWVLEKDFIDCAIPGMVNMEQVVENVGALEKRIGWNERKVLDKYYTAIKDRYCSMCGTCAGTCRGTTEIQSINRALMYYEGYGDTQLARTTYCELGRNQSALSCLTCSLPTCVCANGIKIAERMRYAHALLG